MVEVNAALGQKNHRLQTLFSRVVSHQTNPLVLQKKFKGLFYITVVPDPTHSEPSSFNCSMNARKGWISFVNRLLDGCSGPNPVKNSALRSYAIPISADPIMIKSHVTNGSQSNSLVFSVACKKSFIGSGPCPG